MDFMFNCTWVDPKDSLAHDRYKKKGLDIQCYMMSANRLESDLARK